MNIFDILFRKGPREQGLPESPCGENSKLLEILNGKEQDSKLYRNKEALLDDLKKNHIKKIGFTMLWHKWEKICIHFPKLRSPVINIRESVYELFVSDDVVDYNDLDADSELKRQLGSFDKLIELLEAFYEYMKEAWVYMDSDSLLCDNFIERDKKLLIQYPHVILETFDFFTEITGIKKKCGEDGLRLKDVGNCSPEEKGRIIFTGNWFDLKNQGSSHLLLNLIWLSRK